MLPICLRDQKALPSASRCCAKESDKPLEFAVIRERDPALQRGPAFMIKPGIGYMHVSDSRKRPSMKSLKRSIRWAI